MGRSAQILKMVKQITTVFNQHYYLYYIREIRWLKNVDKFILIWLSAADISDNSGAI